MRGQALHAQIVHLTGTGVLGLAFFKPSFHVLSNLSHFTLFITTTHEKSSFVALAIQDVAKPNHKQHNETSISLVGHHMYRQYYFFLFHPVN